MVEEEVDGGGVARASQTGDLAGADGGDARAAAERLAGVDVREVYLDRRQGDGLDRIAEGDRGVGERARVEDEPARAPAVLVEEVDERALVVTLEAEGTVAPRAFAAAAASASRASRVSRP